MVRPMAAMRFAREGRHTITPLLHHSITPSHRHSLRYGRSNWIVTTVEPPAETRTPVLRPFA